jgi:hypothetical protein
MRIDTSYCAVLRIRPDLVNTSSTTRTEVTDSEGRLRPAAAGRIPVNNQTVPLKGVTTTPRDPFQAEHELLKASSPLTTCSSATWSAG